MFGGRGKLPSGHPTVVFWHGTHRWHPACSEAKGPGSSTPSGERRSLNWLHWDLKERWTSSPRSPFSSFQMCCCGVGLLCLTNPAKSKLLFLEEGVGPYFSAGSYALGLAVQADREKRETRASFAGGSRLTAASPHGSALAAVSVRPLMGTRERWARTLVPRAVCPSCLCDFCFW